MYVSMSYGLVLLMSWYIKSNGDGVDDLCKPVTSSLVQRPFEETGEATCLTAVVQVTPPRNNQKYGVGRDLNCKKSL